MTLVLKIHVQGAEPYEIGGGYWGEATLETAIHGEASTLAADAGSDLLEAGTEACRVLLRDQVIEAATRALVKAGDAYRDPTGVLWSLGEVEA